MIETDLNDSTKALLLSIAEATVASFKLEGITLTIDEAYQMALQAYEKRARKGQVG